MCVYPGGDERVGGGYCGRFGAQIMCGRLSDIRGAGPKSGPHGGWVIPGESDLRQDA